MKSLLFVFLAVSISMTCKLAASETQALGYSDVSLPGEEPQWEGELEVDEADQAAAEGDKARVVCFGDSITKRGYPALLGEDLGVEAINAGVAGHSSAAGLRRMQKDVLDLQPDVVVIFFGTNDARVDSERVHVPVKKYEENLNKMVDACEKNGSKVVICTLPPIDEAAYFKRHEPDEFNAAGGIGKLWGGYRAAAVRVAKAHRLPLVDLNQELLKDPKWLSPDGVHPSAGGSRLIARLISAKVSPLISNP